MDKKTITLVFESGATETFNCSNLTTEEIISVFKKEFPELTDAQIIQGITVNGVRMTTMN